MEDEYEYEPIVAPHNFRLVLLPPTDLENPDAPLNVVLHPYVLSEMHQKYVALSYLWGKPDRAHTISVNGKALGVTENLMYFLRRPRPTWMRFWIDAICIDQSNIEEENTQVPMMRSIYKNAAMVNADLGPATESEERTVQQMNGMSKIVMAEVERVGVKSKTNREPMLNEMRLPFIDPYDAEFWDNVGRIFARPWWSRAW